MCVLLFPTLGVTDRQYTLETVFAVQHIVTDVHRQIVFKPRRVVAQNLIEINGAWRLEERGYELFGADAQFVDHIVWRSLYPTNVEAKAFGDIKQIFDSQIQALQADIFRGSFQIRKVVLQAFLMCANEEVGELATRDAGLRQHFRNRDLQDVIGKQKARLQRHAADTAAVAFVWRDVGLLRLIVKKPSRIFWNTSAITSNISTLGTRFPRSIIDK